MNLLYLRWSIWTGLHWSISSGFRWSICSGESGQFVPAYYGQFHWNLQSLEVGGLVYSTSKPATDISPPSGKIELYKAEIKGEKNVMSILRK